MSYTKQNFSSKSVLYASQLNAMDNQIAANESSISSIQSTTNSNKSSITSLSSSVSDVRERVTTLEEETPPRAYLVKGKGQKLEFHVDNLPAGDYVLHYVRRCVKNCSYDWTPLSELDAYQIYGSNCPSYMSNGGHMPEDYTFSIIEDGFDFSMDWSCKQVFTNMVKQRSPSSTNSDLCLVGVSVSGSYRSIPISFYVTKKESNGSETVVARSENIAYIAGNARCGISVVNNSYLNGLRISVK